MLRNIPVGNHAILCGPAIIAVAALISDLKTRKIPNILTFSGIAGGLAFHMLNSGIEKGAIFSLKGAIVGGLLFLLPFLLGGAGGGDVKLLAALGAWLGTRGIINLFLYSAIIGALISLALMIKNNSFHLLKNVWNDIVVFF